MSKMTSKERALGMYSSMYAIRQYEETVKYLFFEGIMPGTIHQSAGEEASAVGIIYDLRREDVVFSTHRPAGHDIAKGVSIRSMMCEMFGKAEGCCGGKGGAMHTGDFSLGVPPANAIVGGNIPIAAGAALAFKMQKKDNVAVSFMGDGATNEGAFHEGINFAAVWKLPVIYVCENNLYSATTSIHLTTLLDNPAADRGIAYGCPGTVVDGNDVLAVNEAMAEAVARARAGEGPTIIELKTYRKYGHSRNDACGYRPKEEETEWFAKDPVKCFRDRILSEGVASDDELINIEDRLDEEIDEAVEYAKNAPFPALESAERDIYAD